MKSPTLVKARWLLSLVVVLLCDFFSLPGALADATPMRKAVFAYAGVNERYGCLFIAKDQRYFDDQGLDLQIVQVRSGPIAISAMAAGEAQFYTASATGATIGAMAGGFDLVFIGGLINKLEGEFVVAPKIKNPSDLKGKMLGVQSIGGGIWMYTLLALDNWGLEPERDKIQLRVIGDQAVLAQALTTGIIDGAFLGSTFGKMLQRQGYRILPRNEVAYQSTGILARRSLVDKSPDLVEKTLRALTRAITFIQDSDNKPVVTRSLTKWLRLARPDDAEAGY